MLSRRSLDTTRAFSRAGNFKQLALGKKAAKIAKAREAPIPLLDLLRNQRLAKRRFQRKLLRSRNFARVLFATRGKRRLNPAEDAHMRRGKKLARMLENCQARRLPKAALAFLARD